MATVTTSGTFPAAVNGFGMTGEWRWSSTATDAQQAANKSTLTVSLYVNKNSGSTTLSDNFRGNITINESVQPYGPTRWSLSAVTTNILIISREVEITHDANGSKSIPVSGNYGDTGPPPLASWTSSAGSATIPLYDFTRLPNIPGTLPSGSAPSISNKTATSLTLLSAVSTPLSPAGPAITYQYQVRSSTNNGVTWSAWSAATPMATPPSGTSISGLNATTSYQYQTRATSTEGDSAWSPTATASPLPAFTSVGLAGNITTLPDTGTFSVAYTGTVAATNATSIAVQTGSLPPGLTTSSATVSGTTTLTISGTPTAPGVFPVTFRATGPGGTADSGTQYFTIGAAGPWVYSDDDPTGIDVTNVSVAAFNEFYNLATLTTGTHGITEKNQPITISEIEGTYSLLNVDTWVYSIPNSTSLTILVPLAFPTGSEEVTATIKKYYSRAELKVFLGGWNEQTNPATQILLNVKYAGGLWVACGRGTSVFTSEDGVSWAARSTPSTSEYIMDVDYGLIDGVEGWIAFDQLGNKLTSFDASTWTLTSSIFGSQSEPVRRVRYADGLWVTAGGGGKIASSSDGLSWTVRTSGTSTVLYGLEYGDGVWIADGNTTVTSGDGITWSAVPGGTGVVRANAIGYSDGRFVAVGNSGEIATSDDAGVTWVSRSSGVTNALWGVSNFGTTWIAVGGNVLISQNNGVTWAINEPELGVAGWWGVDFDESGLALVVGQGGKIATYGTFQKSAFMRIYDPTYTDGAGSNWRPLS